MMISRILLSFLISTAAISPSIAQSPGDIIFRAPLPGASSLQSAPSAPLSAAMSVAIPSVSDEGTNFSSHLQVEGGVEPYQFALEGGSLPSSLSITDRGVLAGLMHPAGSYNGQIVVRDAAGDAFSIPFDFQVAAAFGFTMQPSNISVNDVTEEKVPFVSAGDGNGISYNLTPNAPSGVSIDAEGTLSIARVPAGTYNLSVQATNANGKTATSNPFELVVAEAPVTRMTGPGGIIIDVKGWDGAPRNVVGFTERTSSTGAFFLEMMVGTSSTCWHGLMLGTNGRKAVSAMQSQGSCNFSYDTRFETFKNLSQQVGIVRVDVVSPGSLPRGQSRTLRDYQFSYARR